MALNNLGLGINLNVKGNAEQRFKGVGKEFGKISDLLPPGINNIAQLASKFGPLGLAIAGVTAAFAGFVVVLFKATEAAGQFQTQMAEISTLLGVEQMGLMDGLSQGALDMSVKYGLAIKDVTAATYQAISAGTDAAKVFGEGGFMEIAGKLAIGGKTDMETAVDGLSAIKNAYNLSIGQMTDVSDKLFLSMKAGRTTITELSKNIGMVTPIASEMGIGIGEVLGMISTLSKTMPSTSIATTGMKAAMQEVSKAAPRFAKAANKYGISYDAATIKQKGFVKWLQESNTAIKAAGGKWSDLIGSSEGLMAVLSLTGSGAADVSKNIMNMGNSAGIQEEAFKKMANTYEFSVKQADAASSKFMITLGKIFLPARHAWVKFKTMFFTGLTQITEWIDKYIIQPWADAWKPFMRWFTTITIPAWKFLGKILLWLGGIAVRAIVKGFLMPFRIVGWVLGKIIDAVEWLIKNMGPSFNAMGKSIENAWKNTMEFVFALLGLIPQAVHMIITNIAASFVFLIKWLTIGVLQVVRLLELVGGVQKGTYKMEVGKAEVTAERLNRRAGNFASNVAGGLQNLLSNAVEEGMEKRDKKREEDGKDKPPQVNIKNTTNIGGKKVHESSKSWEEELLLRDFVAVR